MPLPAEVKDISTMSGGTFTMPAFGSGRVTQPGVIATPVENALAGMARLHNAMHGSDPAKHADVAALRAVYRRGQRSFNRKRHPSSSRRQAGMKRVRQHLAMLATGQRPHARYTGDDDLLPASHPLAASSSGERKALLVIEGRRHELGVAEPMPLPVLALAIGRKSYLDAIDALEVKGVWDPDKHPRDAHGRFVHLGAEVAAAIDGKQQTGTVVAMGRGQLTVRTADGTEHKVAAGSAQVTNHVGDGMTLAEHAKAHTQADTRARQMIKAGHPEAAAWTQRRDALGEALKDRAGKLSPAQVRAGLAGEHVDGPHAPPGTNAGPDVPDLPEGSDPKAYADHLNKIDPDGKWAVVRPANRRGYDVVSTARGNVGRSFDEQGKDLGGAVGRMGGGPAGLDTSMPGDGDTRPDGTDWGSGYSPGDPRNDPAYDKYVANLDAKIEAAYSHVGPTDVLFDHVDGIAGAYQPDRKALHDAILNELMTSYAKMPREHKAIMLAGPPGAGKSTTIKKLGHLFGVTADDKGTPTNYAVVNPDDIKEMIISRGGLPGAYTQQYGLGEQETAALIHEESSHLSKRLMTQLLAHGTNTILDGTFSGDVNKNMRKVTDLRSEGYTVTGVLVDGDIERSLINAGKRHTKGETPDPTGAAGPLAGRYVPLGHIEAQRPAGMFSDTMQRPHRSQNAENFEAARPVFNGGVQIYDNSSGESKLVYREEPGTDETPSTLSEGLGDEHLDKIRNGTTGNRAHTGDLPSVIALGLRQAVDKNRPQYVEGGYAGYGAADAPVGTDYFQVTPQGHVHNIKKNVRTGEVTRKAIPKGDVEKIVDHYIRPRRQASSQGAPRVKNPNPARLGQPAERTPSQGTPGALAGGKAPDPGIRPIGGGGRPRR